MWTVEYMSADGIWHSKNFSDYNEAKRCFYDPANKKAEIGPSERGSNVLTENAQHANA